jgi:hypothetical protein
MFFLELPGWSTGRLAEREKETKQDVNRFCLVPSPYENYGIYPLQTMISGPFADVSIL